MEKGGECAFSTYYKLKAVADSSSIYNPVFEIIRHWMYFYEFREGIVFVRKRDIDIASYGLSIDSFLWIMNQSIFIVKECPIFSNEKHEHYHQKCQIENGIFYYFENIIEKHMTVSTMANAMVSKPNIFSYSQSLSFLTGYL